MDAFDCSSVHIECTDVLLQQLNLAAATAAGLPTAYQGKTPHQQTTSVLVLQSIDGQLRYLHPSCYDQQAFWRCIGAERQLQRRETWSK